MTPRPTKQQVAARMAEVVSKPTLRQAAITEALRQAAAARKEAGRG